VPEPIRPRPRTVIALAFAIGLSAALLYGGPEPRPDTVLGVTFSPRFARYLGLDPQAVFADMLERLGVRHVRLPLYWDEIEPTPDNYDFSDLDFYLEQSRVDGASILMSVGYKQPRWPECFAPAWAVDLPPEELQRRILRLVEAEVVYARDSQRIAMWQAENEPFVPYGECPGRAALTSEFLSREISLIHRLDARPVILTDSGEGSTWLRALQLSNAEFGLSLYRDIPIPPFGVWHYPLPAWSYAAKDRLARTIVGNSGTTVVTELQAEAWFEQGGLLEIHHDVHKREFPPERVIVENLEYARRTHFPRIYLWGVEWWYWMSSRGHPEYLETARAAFGSAAAAQPAGYLRP
jgi:hypothetical protein